jgi:type I restriction enzyme M protein
LEQQAAAHYARLSVAEIKRLVVADKWLVVLETAVHNEIERAIQALVARVKLLEERYADPLPHLEAEVDALAAKMAGHLEKMGVLL